MEKIEQQIPMERERTPVSQRFVVAQFVLRILVVVFTATAIALMATSDQSILMFGFRFSASYHDSSAFKFIMGADIVVGALTLLSLVGAYFVYKKPSNLNHSYYLFLSDLILTVLMISACGAATAIGLVALNGQQQTLWMKVCDRVGNFCVRNEISVAFSYATFLCLFALTIMSSYKLHKS